MKIIHLLIVTFVTVLSQNICGAEPVLVTDYTIDTSLYAGFLERYQIFRGLTTISSETQGSFRTMFVRAFRKKTVINMIYILLKENAALRLFQ
jgi:hypothetical protein